MTIGPENLGNGSAATQERFAGQIGGYRGLCGDALAVDGGDASLVPRNGVNLDHGPDLDQGPSLPSLHLDGLTEPVFEPSQSWLEVHVEGSAPLADHPLLRGLLLELPPKGTVPPPGWLDRWFEAARCILELLYAQDSGRNH